MSVYVISDGSGFVKIGFARNICERIKQLQCGNARTLVLLYEIDTYTARYYDCDLEHALHQKYAEYRVMNDNYGQPSEWFRDDCVADIDRLDSDAIYNLMRDYFPRRRVFGDAKIYKFKDGRRTKVERGLQELHSLASDI